MTKRPIAPLHLPDLIVEPPLGSRPEITWMAPTDILVEELYQRNLSEGSRRLIASIVKNWDWRKVRPGVVAYTEHGLEAIDGQHTMIAAATLGIPEVPVIIVEVDEIEGRAGLFVAVNQDRLALTQAQLHAAKVLAGDPEAVRLGNMCAKHGIKLLRCPPPQGRYKPRECVAFRTIASLLRRYEQADVEKILAAVANTDAAPISAELLKAAEHLLTNPEFASEIDPALITAAALSLPDMGEAEAKLFAATHAVQLWRALAAIWFKASKRLPKRPAPKLATVPAEPAYVPPAPRPKHQEGEEADLVKAPVRRPSFATAARRPSFEPAGFNHGDPPPGRSALDQRRTGA